MRVVVQRVLSASVAVDGKPHASIGKGLLVLAGWESNESPSDLTYIAQKVSKMRIFDDIDGLMNRSVMDMEGDILVISQVTLHASTKKGNRPSYYKSAPGLEAEPLYEAFLDELWHTCNRPVKSGKFGADMTITLTNDGPVTITIDSKNKE
ncbi:MAG: D-tyrosyl-tRNA(Tyr) deacylase [Bacteroidetes bacterium]|nr:D-tyrosyl-tRNA(Tyr) deacylase [Bacteroidota bacterium]